MTLKRGVKRLALGTAQASASLAPASLKLLKIGYGPVQRERPGRTVVCISVDFDVTQPSRFEDNRRGTSLLCDLAGRYGIPLTWAVCGMTAEADMRSYSHIADGSGGSEIGVHTYSHMDATAASGDEFRADIERCIQVLGLNSPRTFVFPWNREAHFDVLLSLGFRAFRGKDRAVGSPVLRQGLWNVRPVYYLDQKSVGAESLIERYLELCIHFSVPFHLWTHPWALSTAGDTTRMAKTLEAVFGRIAERRDRRLLEPSTMGALASTLDSQASPNAIPLQSLVSVP